MYERLMNVAATYLAHGNKRAMMRSSSGTRPRFVVMKFLRLCCLGVAFTCVLSASRSLRAELIGLNRNPGDNTNGTSLIEITTNPYAVSTPILVTGGDLRLSGADFQPGTNILFGSTGLKGDDPGSLFTINVNTGAATLKGSTNFDAVPGLAFDLNGTLFGSAIDKLANPDEVSDRLITIDPGTGIGSLRGVYGSNIVSVDGIAVDPTSGILYGVGNDLMDENFLITIDKMSGAATKEGVITELGSGSPLPGSIVGLAFDPMGNLFGSIGGNPLDPSDRGTIVSIDINALTFTAFDNGFGDNLIDGPVSDIAFNSGTAVPEPSSFALLGLGAAGFLGWRRRKRAAQLRSA